MHRNLIYSDAIADFRGTVASPGAILLEGHEIIAAGSPQEIGETDAVPTQVQGLVIPPLVNVHSHLDLSAIGPQEPTDSFVSWIEHVVAPIRKGLHGDDISATQRGIELSIAGGTSVIGDIASTVEVAAHVEQSKLTSVSFVEVFGLGDRQQNAIDLMQEIPKQYGVSPHAPYSCGREVYVAALNSGRTVATHLSETPREADSTMLAKGELVELAKRVGAWNDAVTPWPNHPLEELTTLFGNEQLIAAHVNYIEETHLNLLANSNLTVAYCPRASAYFGHVGHPYKEMLSAGVQVALGTDSLLCLDTPERISILDEMRFLYRQGFTDRAMLLAMATVHGADALGVDSSLLTLKPGPVLGLLSIKSEEEDAFLGAMRGTDAPQWVRSLKE